MRHLTAFMPALGLALVAGTAQAQTAKPIKSLPVMRGSVQDTLGRPLEGATIEIAGLERRITTASSGSYRFDEITPGKYWVIARRIGYAPLQAALTFNRGDDREIDFQLEPKAQMLPEVMVREERVWKSRYQDFVWRSRGAFGHFLTRDDLEKTNSPYLGDVVRRYLPHVRTENFFMPAVANRTFGGRTLNGGTALASNGCAPAVSVNGGMPNGIWAVNDFRPGDVEAVEVYRAGRMLPAELSGWGASCGLVVVWTQ
jgi:hypothetical protein